MGKLNVVVTLLGLAGLPYVTLGMQDDEPAGQADTRAASSAANSGAASAGAAPSAAGPSAPAPTSASNQPAAESGSKSANKPAPIRMSTTGIIIGDKVKREPPAQSENGR